MFARKLVALLVFGLLVASGIVSGLRPAEAKVRIEVDLTTQNMRVTTGGGDTYIWPVSTARRGFVTPRGTYGVQSLQRMHYSRKYHNSPMPHSIFFRGGYAIHGTYSVGALGQAASHGCVRVSPENAAALYQMVAAEGASITIFGSAPADVHYAKAERRHRHQRDTDYAAQPDAGYAQPTAYAPMQPSYDQWLANPFGASAD